MSSGKTFQVRLTGDFFTPSGALNFQDVGLSRLEAQPQITYDHFDEHQPQITPAQLEQANGVIVLAPNVTKASLAAADDLLAVGRFGVGFDSVDVQSCTDADVVLYTAAGAVDHSVAEATLMWMLALLHRVRIKDNLLRTGNWDKRNDHMGGELRGRTLGIVGLGGIGRALVKLIEPFGMNPPIAADPFLDADKAREAGVELVELDELMKSADFVSVHCPLSDATRDLIGQREIAMMKPTAFLINTARGGIVNEDALYDALKSGRIAGAGIDCFVGEPIKQHHRFSELENVLLAPHSIAWTNEFFSDIGHAVCQGMIDLSLGKRPHLVINPEVLDRPGFKQKWARLRCD